MSTPTPTVGRIVQYRLSAQDAEAINRRREDAQFNRRGIAPNGEQVHVGNRVHAGEVYPLIITRVNGSSPHSSINGQVFLDGNDVYWALSVSEGEGERHYQWPSITPKASA